MEGFIIELSLEIGHLENAIEDFSRNEDVTNDPFMACQLDRLVHARDGLKEVKDALKEYLLDQ